MTQKTESDSPSASGRTLGFLRGKLEVPEDFDAPLPAEMQAVFEGVAEGETSSAQPDGGEGVPITSSKST